MKNRLHLLLKAVTNMLKWVNRIFLQREDRYSRLRRQKTHIEANLKITDMKKYMILPLRDICHYSLEIFLATFWTYFVDKICKSFDKKIHLLVLHEQPCRIKFIPNLSYFS